MTQNRQHLPHQMVNRILLLLAINANIEMTPLSEDYRKLKYCFEMGANPFATNKRGQTAAHTLAERNCFVGVHCIVEVDEKVLEVHDTDGMTPVLYLAEHQCPQLDDYIQARPHYLKQADNRGRTVATFYAEAGDVDSIIHFASLCPDVKQQGVVQVLLNSDRLTPMEKRDACEALSYAGF